MWSKTIQVAVFSLLSTCVTAEPLKKPLHSVMRVAAKGYFAAHRLLGIKRDGVRIVVMNSQRQVLLVQHTYVSGWYLPGGGMQSDEIPADAAARELQEETGVQLLSVPKLLATFGDKQQSEDPVEYLFVADQYRDGSNSNLEIAETAWFDLDDLPADTTPGTRRKIALYLELR